MIDTHSHIFESEFLDDLPEVITRAKEVGVQKIFLPNIDDTTVDADALKKVKEMKKRLTKGHPYIAIGEVGLDLYWDKTYIKEQKQVLEEQIQWALEEDLPLVIHCREAFPELFEVLRPYKETKLSGVFHSFTGTVEEAEELVDYTRFMIGVNGVVTFKKSTLPDALKIIPMERLVLETDSPYLAPVPFRGKRNETSYVKRVALKLAELYEMEIGEVERQTTANALKVFKISE